MWKQSLVLTALAATMATTAQAQVNLRRGGNHDGGGQTVLTKDGKVQIADRYKASTDGGSFVPADAQPVDPLNIYPGLKTQLQTLSDLLTAYGNVDTYSDGKPLLDLATDSAGGSLGRHQYYLVQSLPEVSECMVTRNNSGVPEGAVVAHVACTRDRVTLLLNAGPTAFSGLEVKVQADILAHEALRSSFKILATESVETIVGGLSVARDILDRQRAGDRSVLTTDEVATLTAMRDEFARVPLFKDHLFGGVSPQGGGIIDDKVNVAPTAFVGIGSRVSGDHLTLDKNVQIIESRVRVPSNGSEGDVIYDGTQIKASDIFVSQLEIGGNTRIDGLKIDAVYFHLGNDVGIKNMVAYVKRLNVWHRSQFTNVKFHEDDYDGPAREFWIGNDVEMKDSVVTDISELHDHKDMGDATLVKMDDGSKMIGANIDYSLGYHQARLSRVENLNLRVKPNNGSSWKTYPTVEVAEGAQVTGDKKPIVLFASYTPVFGVEIFLRGQVDLADASVCAMGFDRNSGAEYGVETRSVQLSRTTDLTHCKPSAKLMARQHVLPGVTRGIVLETLPQRRP